MQTLDELTPYYQARMQWLSPQQRKIVELLCDRRHAVPVKEIAQRCFISHQTASSQLKDLLNKGYVVKQTQGRESFYELLEPLMRICLETKKQRGKPIKLFIDFLRIWYTDEELQNRLRQLPDNSIEKIYIIQALKLEKPFSEIELSKVIIQSNSFFAQGILKFKEGDFTSALEFQRKAISINPKHNLAWGYHGFILGKLNRYQEAIESFKKSLDIESKNSKIWNNLGLAFFYVGQYSNAITAYENGLKITPDSHQLWYNKGIALSALSQYKEEIESYNRAIDIEPNHYQSWFNKGNALSLLYEYEKALEAYKKVLEINPENIEIIYEYISITLFNLEKYEQVISLCDLAIKLYPNNDAAFNNRGLALYKLHKYDDAINSLKMAIEINKNNPMPVFNLGEILLKLNYWDEGFETLKKALMINKNLKSFERENIYGIINLIFEADQRKNIWSNRLKNLVTIYGIDKKKSTLEKGIIKNIPNLFSEMVSNKAARTWLEVWQEVAGDKPELEIALRFLKTAVEYKETEGDSKVLLQLPKEERDLFVTLLEEVKE